MEQPRRAGRAIALGVLFLAGAGVAWGLLRPRGGAEPEAPPEIRIPEPLGITAEVLNGSGRQGLARSVTRMLRRRGVDVLFFGTAEDSVPVTEILVRRGDSLAGEKVAEALGTGQVRVARDTLLRLDVTVLLGRDFEVRGER